jgi:hypothetical protein
LNPAAESLLHTFQLPTDNPNLHRRIIATIEAAAGREGDIR